jgi:hypothetical protein
LLERLKQIAKHTPRRWGDSMDSDITYLNVDSITVEEVEDDEDEDDEETTE